LKESGAITGAHGRRRAAAVFIFLTVTLDMLAVGMILPVLPRLISGFTDGDSARTAQLLGLFASLFSAIQFSFSPVLGALSDRFGRRPVVLISSFGMALDYLLLAWAPSIGWILLGRIISGLTASSIPTAMAYMTDVTPPEKRTSAYGTLSGALGIGFILGPALGGLLGDVNPRLPFWVSCAICTLNAVYGLAILPESLAPEHRCALSWKRANPLGAFYILSRQRANSPFARLSLMLLLGYTAQQSLNVFVIYADYRYHWLLRSAGFYLAAGGVVTGIYSIFLLKRVVAVVGERGSILIGLAAGTAGMVLLGLSTTSLLFCLALPVFSLNALAWPAAQSIMSHAIKPSEHGQLQGAISSLRGIASLTGPTLFTYIFSKSIGPDAIVDSPGLTYYVAGAFLLASLIAAERATRWLRRAASQQTSSA
jgi:DHA1 family tetracycline resistance protein-like MFS transporter